MSAGHAIETLLGYRVIVTAALPQGTIAVPPDVWEKMKSISHMLPEECPRCGSTSLGSEYDGGGVRCGPCGLPISEWATYQAPVPKTIFGIPVVIAPAGSLPTHPIVLGTRAQLIVDCPHCKKETRTVTGMCTHCGKGIFVGTQRQP